MKRNFDLHIHSLVNDIFEVNSKSISYRRLIDHKEWKNKLSDQEIFRINEAWSKFSYAESLVSEGSKLGTKNDRWEEFLKLEDKRSHNDGERSLNELWGSIKKGLKWISKKVAGKRSLEKGGSLFGLGKKSKKQEEEWAKLQEDQKELMDMLRGIVSSDYPNNDEVEEFKEQTFKALSEAEKLIKSKEDPGVRAAMYKSLKKWVSYQLDQKIGDHYKHFMENMSLAGAVLLLEAEEDDALGTKKGSSESIKGLESKLLPTVLSILGGAGLSLAVGIFKTNPELLNPTVLKAVVEERPIDVQTEIENVIPPFSLSERFADKFTPEFFEKVKAAGVVLKGDPGHNSGDFLAFVKDNLGKGDETAGLKEYFRMVKMDDAGGENVGYILKRMKSGMDVQEAFKMPGSAGGVMERFGGAAGVPVSIGGMVARMIVTKTIKTAIIKAATAAGVGSFLSAAGAAALGGAGVGGILAGFAISRLRKKSRKDSRAAFLDDLFDQIEKLESEDTKKDEKDKDDTEPPVPPEPVPPEEKDGKGSDEGKGKNKLGNFEVDKITNNVMKDLGTYMEEIDANYESEIPKSTVFKLVKLLNDNGKLKFDEYNDDDKTIEDIMKKVGSDKKLPKQKQDDLFMRNVPPAYKAIPNQWKRKAPELSADISDVLGDKMLPLHMLSLRRALAERVIRSIFKHARILHERKNNNDKLIVERWNRLAGIIK